jgi:hypothetical protein
LLQYILLEIKKKKKKEWRERERETVTTILAVRGSYPAPPEAKLTPVRRS